MSDQNKVIDESGDPKYYIMTPQIVMALCDSPYEYTLWNAIKCVTGEVGECFLATEDLAAMAMMSAGKCSQCRKSLIDKGLLLGEIRKDPGYPQPVWHLTIPNLWTANRKWREENPSLLDRIALKREQKKSLHHVKPSPREEPPSQDEEPPSPDETKKNQKEEPKETTTTSDNDFDEKLSIISQVYESEIGIISPSISDSIKDCIDTYPLEWIKESIAIAAKQNKRRWAYVEGILRRWQTEGKNNGHKPDKPKPLKERRKVYSKVTGEWTGAYYNE